MGIIGVIARNFFSPRSCFPLLLARTIALFVALNSIKRSCIHGAVLQKLEL